MIKRRYKIGMINEEALKRVESLNTQQRGEERERELKEGRKNK